MKERWEEQARCLQKFNPAKGHRHDLLATVRIMLPENSDADLDALMKTWKADKTYNPRKDM